MSESLIERVRKLQRQRGEVSPFASHTEFLAWSDEVIPLLSFNTSLQSQFRSAVSAANINRSLDVPDGADANINRAIGLLNQAITSLEIDPAPNPSTYQANGENGWYKKPIGQIGIGVFIVVLGVLAVYLLKTHTGLPL